MKNFSSCYSYGKSLKFFLLKLSGTSILMYKLFSPHINQLLATSRVSYNSTLFQHYLPGNSVRFYVKGLSPRGTSPQPYSTSDTNPKSRLSLAFTTDWLYIRGFHTHSLGLIHLLEQLTEMRGTFNY